LRSCRKTSSARFVSPADEVRGVRLEDDVPPVRADAARQGAAELILSGGSLGAAAGHADARGGSGRGVAYEDVVAAVGVAANEVRRERVDDDEAAAGADPGREAVVVSLRAGGRDADARRGCRPCRGRGGRGQRRSRQEYGDYK
jgi:hypothetical protein